MLAIFYPFKGLMLKRQSRLKNSYKNEPSSISSRDAYYILPSLAWDEFNDGNYSKSEEYANELMKLNKTYDKNWNTGNAIHHSHTIIGLINLEHGNIQSAINHLIKSSKTTGSPQLNSFGPSFLLAKKLYEHGEDDSVIKYLDNCQNFWKSNNGLLSKWVSEIKKGETPDFCQTKT